MPNAIVTGATQGIGRAIAEKLLSEGCFIAITARNKEQLTKQQKEWKQQFPAATIIASNADIGNKEEVTTFAATAIAALGSIDILVNNAGAYIPGLITEEREGVLEQMINVNLFGAYHLSRKILPVMKKAGSGHIFNICSVASLQPLKGGGSYSISKHALLALSDNLREELREHNIKVTAICPGSTYTTSWEQSDVDPQTILEANDIAAMLWSAYKLSLQAGVENIILRPVKGNL